MATMTIPEAYYAIYNVLGPALVADTNGHRYKPLSALKGYKPSDFAIASNLAIANETLYFSTDVEQLQRSLDHYNRMPLMTLSITFKPDDKLDDRLFRFEFDDPRFLSMETAPSFAEFCKSLGLNDSLYWQKVYTRLGLEYTATSPQGNQVQEPSSRGFSPKTKHQQQRPPLSAKAEMWMSAVVLALVAAVVVLFGWICNWRLDGEKIITRVFAAWMISFGVYLPYRWTKMYAAQDTSTKLPIGTARLIYFAKCVGVTAVIGLLLGGLVSDRTQTQIANYGVVVFIVAIAPALLGSIEGFGASPSAGSQPDEDRDY
jgi:hypothetical protein